MKASLIVNKVYENNKIFDLSNTQLNRDNCLYSFVALKNEFLKLGVDVSTSDINKPEDCDFIILNDRPYPDVEFRLRKSGLLKKTVLIIYESALIRPDNWDCKFHRELAGVLTWSSELLTIEITASKNNLKHSSPRYSRGGFTHKFPNGISRHTRNKFCTLIAANKMEIDSRELYSSRRAVIDWFERNEPESFIYYGRDWNYYYLKGGVGTRVLKKIGLLKYLPNQKSVCYGGEVESKQAILREFDFCICFENAKNIKGYITEKIFDCFFAGCIPIYWGAPDVSEYIPDDCYVDYTKFNSIKDLYEYMRLMSASQKEIYRLNIESFLKSEKAKIFSADDSAKWQSAEILNFINNIS